MATLYEQQIKALQAREAANNGMSSTDMRRELGIGMGGLNTPLSAQPMQGMPAAPTGPLLNGLPWDQAMAQINAQKVAGNNSGGGMSNSDLFFSSANTPLKTGQISSITPTPNNQQASGNAAAIASLLETLKGGSERANADSLKQHDALMASVTGAQGKVDKYLGQLGQTGETRIAENQAKAKGSTEQDLISRGLGNTTVRQTALRGVDRDAEVARQALGESIAQQKIGTTMGLTNMYGDALLSRQNQAPDMSLYLQLLQQLGATSGQMAGSLR